MNSVLGRLVGGLLLALYAGLASAAYQLNFQPPVTRIASENYDLHMLMMYVILAIFCVVFGVMFYSIYAHRKSVGHKAEQFHENAMVEIIWTVIPFLILIGMVWPATKTLLALKDTAVPDITIKATGYQWKWGYDYLKGEGVAFLSALATPQGQIRNEKPKGEHYRLEVDHPMVVPVGKKIRLLLTADDVIHSWWVPAFGIKQAAIPGFVGDTWFMADKEGTYRGQCAELCGKDHGFLPIVVEVLSQQEYALWVAEQKKKATATAEDSNKQWSADALKAKGEKVYAANCAACHYATGPAFVMANTSGPRRLQVSVSLGGAFASLTGDQDRQPFSLRRVTILSGYPNQTRNSDLGGRSKVWS